MYLFRILGFLLPYKRRIGLAAFSVLASSGFAVAMPQLIRWAVDFGIDGDGRRTLVIAALAIVGTALFWGTFAFVNNYLGEWLSQRVAYDIRNVIYDRMQRLSFAYHDGQQTGQLMSRATQDVEAVRWYVQFGVLRFSYVLLLLFAVLVIMLVTNWKLALVAWSFFPLIAWRSTVMTNTLRPLWLEVQNGLARITTVLQETLTGARVIKAFAREDYESRRFSREARALFEASHRSSRIQAANGPAMTGIWMLALAATLAFGGREVIEGHLSIGALSAFLLYLTLLQMPVRSLGWIIMVLTRAQSAAQRIYEILDAESAVSDRPGALDLRQVVGHVRFEAVSFGYDHLSPVLRGVDINATPGQLVALIGPMGSGKSTVASLMPRFYDPTEGRICIDGHDIRDLSLASLRRAVGMVQQDVFLFSATMRDNISYGSVDASQESIEAAARAAHIHDFIAGLSSGYDSWIGERGVTLSGGQKQRIAIARTLLVNPRILVLDDSTSSVDMETERLIQQALLRLVKGRTTFVIAHRLWTVMRADQILVMRNGRIVERGSHRELLEHNGLYRRIYDLELSHQEEGRQMLDGADGLTAKMVGR